MPLLSSRRALWLGRSGLHPHHRAAAGSGTSLPDQSLRDDVRRNHRLEPGEGRHGRQQAHQERIRINPAGFTIHSAIHEHARTPAACSTCTPPTAPRWRAAGRHAADKSTALFVSPISPTTTMRASPSNMTSARGCSRISGQDPHAAAQSRHADGRPLGRLRLRADVPPRTGLHHAGADAHAGPDRLSGRAGGDRQERAGVFQSRAFRIAFDQPGLAAPAAQARSPRSQLQEFEIPPIRCSVAPDNLCTSKPNPA